MRSKSPHWVLRQRWRRRSQRIEAILEMQKTPKANDIRDSGVSPAYCDRQDTPSRYRGR